MKKIHILHFIFLFACENADKNPVLSLTKGDMVVCNGGENSISIIDSKLFIEKQRFFIPSTISSFAHHIYFSADFSKISIAMPSYDFSQGHDITHKNPTVGQALVLDSKNGLVSNRISTSVANHDVLIDESNGEIWTQLISNSSKINVYSFDNKLISEISINSDPAEIIFANNNTLALVAGEESNFLTLIDKKTKSVLKEIKIDLNPTGLSKGRSDTEIIVSNANKKSINIVNLDVLKVVDFIDLDFSPGYASFKNQTELWILAPQLNKIKVFEKSGLIWKLKTEIATGNDPHHFLFFNNFQNVILANQKSNTLDIFNTNDYKLIKNIKTGSKPNGIAIWD
jgi:DNA-binding beta-propeller fold protein YncE